MTSAPVTSTSLLIPIFGKGKVRDTYVLGDDLLIIATDRISAFDVILPCGIPDKGKVLNQISAFWFGMTSGIMENHVIAPVERLDQLPEQVARTRPEPSYLIGRSMIVRKASLIPVECVARGYVSGSAWSEYQERGTACGIKLPRNLRESDRLEEPIFTPTTKAETGHDMPLTRREMAKLVGESLADELETRTKQIYNVARDYALKRGIIIADTKMEFGKIDSKVILIDELLTPDSSRFWEASEYRPGQSQPSYDKQPVRDWLVKQGWDKKPPAPMLSNEVIEQTAARYREAFHRLTGRNLA